MCLNCSFVTIKRCCGRYDEAYRAFDCLLPWTVGRFSDADGAASYFTGRWRADAAACCATGQALAPVVWPGLSEGNLHRRPGRRNAVRREGGLFLWEQCRQAAKEGAAWIYVAMFDEVLPEGGASACEFEIARR